MNQELIEAKRITLSLLGGRWPGRTIDPALLDPIAEMAAAHRLGPLLAWQAERHGWDLPGALARTWTQARRDAGIAALAQQAALRLALQTLAAAGIAAVALKGLPLAWRHYPEPGLRPMRDIDLLVAGSQALEAAAALAGAGFVAAASDPASLAQALECEHELPAQHHAGLGVTIELHHRLTDPPARRAYRVPQLDPAAVLERAHLLDCGGVAVPSPASTDLASHLVVHALYGHRLDCGPLVLADLHFLDRGGAVDWQALRTIAEREGWNRGLDLVAALTNRWFGNTLPVGREPPPEVIAEAESALLADPTGRGRSEAAADLAAAAPRPRGRSLLRRLAPHPQVVAREGRGMPRWAFWPVWAVRRTIRALAQAGDRRTASEASAAAAVIRWLEG